MDDIDREIRQKTLQTGLIIFSIYASILLVILFASHQFMQQLGELAIRDPLTSMYTHRYPLNWQNVSAASVQNYRLVVKTTVSPSPSAPAYRWMSLLRERSSSSAGPQVMAGTGWRQMTGYIGLSEALSDSR